jgi:two-component system sensor histidine kinase ChiS
MTILDIEQQLPQNLATNKSKILIIDDNFEALALQKTLLGIEGYEVITAQGGPQAFDILSIENNKPDLILLDIQMQEMSGPEFLILLEQKKPDIIKTIPIVFLSGADEVPKSKASGFIRKASRIEVFLSAIRSFVGKNS